MCYFKGLNADMYACYGKTLVMFSNCIFLISLSLILICLYLAFHLEIKTDFVACFQNVAMITCQLYYTFFTAYSAQVDSD